MYGAEADDSMTARRDCLGSIDMNDGIVRRPRYRGWTRDRYDCSRASPFHSHERENEINGLLSGHDPRSRN